MLCPILGTKYLTTTAYQPRKNGQSERVSRTSIARLGHYVAETQRDWVIYLELLTYDYNMQAHQWTNVPPFSPTMSRQSTDPTTFDYVTALPTDASRTTSSHVLRAQLLHWLSKMRHNADSRLTTAQRRYKDDHDRRLRKTPKKIESRQYLYFDPSLMKTPATECMATESLSRLLSAETGLFCIVGGKPKTVPIDEDSICITVSVT